MVVSGPSASPADLAARIDELGGTEKSCRISRTDRRGLQGSADRAGALDVPVGEEHIRLFVKKLVLLLRPQDAGGMEFEEELRGGIVVQGKRSRE